MSINHINDYISKTWNRIVRDGELSTWKGIKMKISPLGRGGGGWGGEVTEKGQTWEIFSYQAEGSRTGR